MPIRVIFVCVENSNRSQMAEAFARLFGGPDVEAASAGRRPSGRVNPKAVAAMAERNQRDPANQHALSGSGRPPRIISLIPDRSGRRAMKKGIHPEYRPVVFLDAAANYSFLTRSTVKTEGTIKWTDGNEYPLHRVEISSASHPFFTGKMKFVDAAGRVEKFQKKFQRSSYGQKKGAAEQPAADKK